MIPITRKELYLNKIVGNNDYETPEKPISEEEFFFAEILGEAVQAPEPLTRYQMYLAKIAGREIEIPYPETRLEYFLARAAGMNVEAPTPITKEEIYWSNYTAIVELEVEGVPPLTYKAIEGTLENYRIYGNTVDGESVGDRTGNLFDGEWISGFVPSAKDGELVYSSAGGYTDYISIVSGNITLTVQATGTRVIYVFLYANDKSFIGVAGKQITNYGLVNSIAIDGYSNAKYVRLRTDDLWGSLSELYMLNTGSTPLPYEPYGYKVPVTISNGTDTLTTPIYLPEQIKKVGDEAEYIDYAEQKMHRIGADDIDVTLPALPTLPGTNVLSVGTAVQPSKVYVKYKGERQ